MKVKKNKKITWVRFTPFQGYSLLWERVGCILTLHLAREVVCGCCPLGSDRLVSCFLLAGLENLLLCLLPAEEVGVRFTSHWGRGGLHAYSALGVWLGFLWLLPSGEWLLHKNK